MVTRSVLRALLHLHLRLLQPEVHIHLAVQTHRCREVLLRLLALVRLERR